MPNAQVDEKENAELSSALGRSLALMSLLLPPTCVTVALLIC